MKKTIKFLAIAVLVFSITSCDKTDDIGFNTSVSQKIPVHINQGEESIDQTKTVSFDNIDTHDYLGKFVEVSIAKFTYKITDFTGDEEGSVDISISIDGVSLLQENIVVKQANDNSTIFEITDVSKLNVIANALLNKNHEMSFYFTGTSSAPNDVMDFKIDVTIDIAITAAL
ncbi:MAG: hypothetical protein KAH07_08710 [Flavobacteriaceae bacterium]|nr:hypothetical protein [Flavobacteriaceae bacterium]